MITGANPLPLPTRYCCRSVAVADPFFALAIRYCAVVTRYRCQYIAVAKPLLLSIHYGGESVTVSNLLPSPIYDCWRFGCRCQSATAAIQLLPPIQFRCQPITVADALPLQPSVTVTNKFCRLFAVADPLSLPGITVRIGSSFQSIPVRKPVSVSNPLDVANLPRLPIWPFTVVLAGHPVLSRPGLIMLAFAGGGPDYNEAGHLERAATSHRLVRALRGGHGRLHSGAPSRDPEREGGGVEDGGVRTGRRGQYRRGEGGQEGCVAESSSAGTDGRSQC